MRTAVLALVVIAFAMPAARAGDARDLSTKIDVHVGAALAKDRLTSAGRAEQYELLRRVYLDVLGRIPTPEETEAYVKDPDPEKHHRLIDALLAHPEMPVYWRGVFHHWLNGTLEEKRAGADEFLAFLEKRLADNARWDKIATELLDPSDADATGAAAAYYLASRLSGDRAEQLDAMTTSVSSIFFGVQMQCAKCHDHPTVAAWKQANYYGLAAFLGRTYPAKGKFNLPGLTERAEGEIKFSGRGKGEQTAQLLFLDGKVIDAKGSRRKALIDAGINATNPYFRRAMANRMWKQLMGVGLVEPVDQIHSANPASHPVLLDDLADDFAKNGFDLRRLMAAILHSEAYLRSSRWAGPGPRPAPQTYAVGALKPLSPPQLALALAQATGYADVLRAKYERDRAKLKVDAVTLAVVRKQFEREREYAALLLRFKQDSEPFQANAAHALYLTYNPLVRAMLAPNGLVGKLTKLKDADVARVAYLAALSRPPTTEEAAEIAAHLATPGVSREELCRDVVWALVAGAEFRFNH
jgi:hypothetical protein